MSSQQRSFFRHHSSESAKAATNYVPGASITLLALDASSGRAQSGDDDDDDETSRGDSFANQHTPDEKTRLLVTQTIEETPPFVACFAFCFMLNVMLACFFLGILIVYLHYRFGYTTPTVYNTELCSYMKRWNQDLFWLFVATCALGVVDLVSLCLVLASTQDGYENDQQQYNPSGSSITFWRNVRTVCKYIIDVVFFVLIVQAFFKTNRNVENTDECPNMYLFTHIYSTFVTVMAILGIASSCLLWSIFTLRSYSNVKSRRSIDAPVSMTV